MTDKTTTKRQAAFKDRQREKGLIQVTVWVPADKKGALKTYANSLVRDKSLNA